MHKHVPKYITDQKRGVILKQVNRFTIKLTTKWVVLLQNWP